MPKSIPSRLLLPLLLVWPFASRAAEEFTDDAALKASFEAKLGSLFEEGGVPPASSLSKQLREKTSTAVVLPSAEDSLDTPIKIHERARSSTLILGHLFLCDTCDKYHAKLAGGVLISPDGLALTNYHVLDAREAIVFGAMTADGGVYVIDEILASSAKDDIALLQLREAEGLPFVPLQEKVEAGDELFVFSHPDGFFYSFTKGYLSRKYLTAKTKAPRLQITADFAKGSSGSGIFNSKGELIGIAAATNSIYFEKSGEKPGNLQMVIKSGVPVSSALKLISPDPEPLR